MSLKSCVIVSFIFALTFGQTGNVSAQAATLTSFPLPDEHATVYDENKNGVPDMVGDTWVFNDSQSNKADLIIRFRLAPGLTAFFYDDVDGNGQVDYSIGATELQILESSWRAQVLARDNDWFLPGGLPDWNLDVQIDGKFSFINGVSAIPRQDSCGNLRLTTTAIQLLDKNVEDGSTTRVHSNFLARYWDLNQDGVPDYEWHNTQNAGPFDVLIVNKSPNLRYKLAHRLPILDTVLWTDSSKARIWAVRFLIPDSGTEASYVLSFDHTVVPGSVSVGVEDPTAYYSLQEGNHCVHDLKVQAISLDHEQRQSGLAAYNQVRYSWMPDNGGGQYRLFLIGQAFINRVNTYPMFSVTHIPYEDLPSFALDNQWVGASFAEMEDTTRIVNIGDLPENPFYISILDKTLMRPGALQLPERYLPVFLSLREEYNLSSYNNRPLLYMSSIDRRVHLLGAEQGMIIFSADTTNAWPGFDFSRESLQTGHLVIQSATSYSDTDQDGYIDTWIYQENEKPVTALVIRPDAALLASSNRLMVKRLPANFKPSVWDLRPPVTEAEWKTYNDGLSAVKDNRRSLKDLAGIFNDLPGDVSLLSNTSLTSVSRNAGKLITQITTSGFSVSGSVPFNIGVGGRVQAGAYVLYKDAENFVLQPVSVVPLQISSLDLKRTDPAPPGQFAVLFFNIQNPGNVDANTRLQIWDQSNSDKVLMQDRELVIPAYDKVDIDVPWLPVSSGNHRILVQVDNGFAGTQSSVSRQELSEDITLPDAKTGIFLFDPAYFPPTIFFLIVLSIFFLSGLWVALRALEGNDESSIE